MTPKRFAQLHLDNRTRLTRKEIKRGYHFCSSWYTRADAVWRNLLISYGDWYEYSICNCDYCPSKTRRRAIKKRAKRIH